MRINYRVYDLEKLVKKLKQEDISSVEIIPSNETVMTKRGASPTSLRFNDIFSKNIDLSSLILHAGYNDEEHGTQIAGVTEVIVKEI